MGLFGIFGKKGKAEIAGEMEEEQEDIEVYSGIRVEVMISDDQLLFVAKLVEAKGDTALLQQYSETEASLGNDPLHVRIRGYSAHNRKAVYMEGVITPETKRVWKVDDLVITKVENDRAFFRLNVNVDAAITRLDELDAEEKMCKVLNISIGGVYISSEDEYAEGCKFLLRVKLLEDSPESELRCEVLRIIEKEETGHEYGCRFLEITEEDQQKITKNMFTIQSKRRDIC